MASGFYNVPRVPMQTSASEPNSDDEENSLLTRRDVAQRKRRRSSSAGPIRSSMTLPIIPEATDDLRSDLRYNIVYKDGRIHLVEQTIPMWYDRFDNIPAPAIKISILITSIIFMTAALVTLVLYNKSVTMEGGDMYIAMMASMFWVTVCFGLLYLGIRCGIKSDIINSQLNVPFKPMVVCVVLLALFLVLYFGTSLPWRVSPRIQMILLATHIPFLSLANFTFFQKGLNCKQICCILVLFAGMFVMMEPALLGVNYDNLNDLPPFRGDKNTDNERDSKQTGVTTNWYHALLHTMSWVPFSFWLVYSKKLMQKHETNFITFLAWNITGSFLILLFIFWVNFIPSFGQASDLSDFWNHLQDGLGAFYGGSADVQVTAAIFIIFFSTGLLFYHILMTCEEADMICYAATMAAGVSALGTIFWTLFSPLPNMQIQLGLTNTGIFTIVGVIVLILSAMGFAHFEENAQQDDSDVETLAISRMQQPRRYDAFAPRGPLIPAPTKIRSMKRTKSEPSIVPKIKRTKSVPVMVSM